MIKAENLDDENPSQFMNMLYNPVDLQRDSSMQVICVEAEGQSYLYFMAYYINFDKAQMQKYFARIMSVLEGKYPCDESIHGWREIFDGTLTGNLPRKTKATGESKLKVFTPSKSKTPPEICIYSEKSDPNMTFIHTGNTGSEAYYRLSEISLHA